MQLLKILRQTKFSRFHGFIHLNDYLWFIHQNTEWDQIHKHHVTQSINEKGISCFSFTFDKYFYDGRFLTYELLTGGGIPESKRATELSKLLSVPISPSQVTAICFYSHKVLVFVNVKGQLLPNFIAGYTGAFAFQAACKQVGYFILDVYCWVYILPVSEMWWWYKRSRVSISFGCIGQILQTSY